MLSANTEQLKEVVVLSGRDVNKVDRAVAKIPLTNMENPQIYNTVSSEIMKQQGFDAQPVLYNGLPGLTSGNLDPAGVEEIQVLKGPSGTLFGGSFYGYGGLIHTITKKQYFTAGEMLHLHLEKPEERRLGK